MDELGLFWIDEELKTDILGKMNRNEIIYDIPPLIKNERYRQSTEAAQWNPF